MCPVRQTKSFRFRRRCGTIAYRAESARRCFIKVLMDLRCDVCDHTIEDHYDEGGLGDYSACPQCITDINSAIIQGLDELADAQPGRMRQIFSTGGFRLGTTAGLANTNGRTSNGTKWEVLHRPRKYDYASKKFGGEVL